MASLIPSEPALPARAVTAIDRTPAASPGLAKTAKDFEAMFLRQMLENILPDAKSGAFGSGTAADMWRSMLAEQVAVVFADRDVLGLQDMLKTKDSQ